MKKILFALCACLVAAGLSLSAKAETVLRVGASPTPHAELLQEAQKLLKPQGITLEIVDYSDYVLPNVALDNKELDANFFQHKPYLDDFNKEKGTRLTSLGTVHYEPFGIYAGKCKDLAKLKDGAVIGVPNDTTNEARALLLLQDMGLITLKEGAGLTATRLDIVKNPRKVKIEEIEAITKKFGMEIQSRDDAGVPEIEIEEDGETFEENSRKKAEAVMRLCGKVTIADDSGLMVEYLGGAPGVYSARFAGEDCSDEKNNEKLLSLLEGVPYKERRAKFVSVITMLWPDGGQIVARGECEGHIIDVPVGENGFGYDPLFVPDGFQRTFAQMTQDEKNKISHRAKALMELEKLLAERNE